MKVGVVIISYNNEKHIVATIESVINQAFKDWTCILVDNGSTDQTFEIIEKKIEGDFRFKAFKKTNEGPGPGRNYGFAHLPDEIEYIHFLDGDDMLYPAFLSEMTAYLDTHSKVGLVACQFDIIDMDGEFIKKGRRSRFAPSRLGFPQDIPLSTYLTPFVSFFSSTAVGPYGVYRRSVFVNTEGYTLHSQEDTDMFCQMSLLAEVHYIPDYLYRKRVTDNNLAYASHYLATHKLFRKKWDFYLSEDPKVDALIRESLKYYYTMHTPLRDFKVGFKSFKLFLRNRLLGSLKWSLLCYKNGTLDFLFRRKYRRIIRERQKLEKEAKEAAMTKSGKKPYSARTNIVDS